MSEVLKKERRYVFILALVQFCHILDFVIMMPLGPFFMDEFGISPTQFALLVSSYNLSAAPFTLLSGIVSDQFDRKKFSAFILLGFTLSTILCGLTQDFYFLILARVVAGGFGGTLNAAILAMMSDLIPPERRGKATGAILSSFSFASVIGIPIGLMIATHFGWRTSFFFIGSLSFLTLIFMMLTFPSLITHLKNKKDFKDVLPHYLKILKKKEYYPAYILLITVSFTSFLLIPFVAPFAVKNVGIHESELQFIYLVGGAFTIFSSRMIGRLCDMWGVHKTFFTAAGLSCIPILIFTNLGQTSLSSMLVITTLFMIFVSGRFVPVVTLATKFPLDSERGVFMSFLNASRSFSTASAAYVGGLIVTEGSKGELIGYDKVGFLGVGLTILTFFLMNYTYKKQKELNYRSSSMQR